MRAVEHCAFVAAGDQEVGALRLVQHRRREGDTRFRRAGRPKRLDRYRALRVERLGQVVGPREQRGRVAIRAHAENADVERPDYLQRLDDPRQGPLRFGSLEVKGQKLRGGRAPGQQRGS